MTITLRQESRGDEEGVERVIVAAFADHPHSVHDEHRIVAALRRAEALRVALVAEDADRIVGYIAFSAVSVSDGATGWYGLGPLAVAPRRQRQGIGNALVRAGLGQLRSGGGNGCVVFGPPDYYQRFGFTLDHRLVFPDGPKELFLAQSFTPAPAAGMVSYHPAFSESAR